MKVQYNSLIENEVWELEELPEGQETVRSKWVFKAKKNADGSFERCKACLVAQSYSQKEGLDYDKAFSPLVWPESTLSVIALAVQHRLMLHQMDITTDFSTAVWIRWYTWNNQRVFLYKVRSSWCADSSRTYTDSSSPLDVGTKCWMHMLMGFKQSKSDPCIYVS